MTSTALAQRSQDKLMERIRALRKLKENRKCFECLSKSPSCVDTTHNTFVCMTCGGILRIFNFRVKSISISSFAANEVEALEAGGNKVARKKWLATFTGDHPASGNTEQIKVFVRKKYEDRVWYAAKPYKSKRKSKEEQSEDSEPPPVERRKSERAIKQKPQPQQPSQKQKQQEPDLLDLNAIFTQSEPSNVQPPFDRAAARPPSFDVSSHSPFPTQQSTFPVQNQPDWDFSGPSAFPQPSSSVQQQSHQWGALYSAQPSFDSMFGNASSTPYFSSSSPRTSLQGSFEVSRSTSMAPQTSSQLDVSSRSVSIMPQDSSSMMTSLERFSISAASLAPPAPSPSVQADPFADLLAPIASDLAPSNDDGFRGSNVFFEQQDALSNPFGPAPTSVPSMVAFDSSTRPSYAAAPQFSQQPYGGGFSVQQTAAPGPDPFSSGFEPFPFAAGPGASREQPVDDFFKAPTAPSDDKMNPFL